MKILSTEKDRQELIKNYLKEGLVLDLGSQDMEGNIKESLHEFLLNHTKNKVIGVDLQKGKYVDVIADLNKRFPFKTNYADNIIAGEIIEHLTNPFGFLEECYRVLKPEGKLILTTPNATGLQIITGKESPHHYFVVSKKNMNLLLEKVGFKNYSIIYLNVYFKRNITLRALGALVPKLRPVLFVHAQK